MKIISRAPSNAVALETTLLVHGLPAPEAKALSAELGTLIAAQGAHAATVGVLKGTPIVGMTDDELAALMSRADVPKANTANLGALIHRGQSAATTVSATMELSASAGVRVFATGGLGGVHKHYGTALDISSDLSALTRFPVAVVASGVKSLLDVVATRETLETLGVSVLGFRTDEFPAFYQRRSGAGVDARFDDAGELAEFVRWELARAGRGVVIANPIPEADEIDKATFREWLAQAEARAEAEGAVGRGVTPAVLGALHEISAGRTLAANLALVRSNATLAAQIAAAIAEPRRA